MNTMHSMADPHLRLELATHGQYCGPRQQKTRPCGADDRDYFDEYCNSVFPRWETCKQLGRQLVDTGDDKLIASVKACRNASRENHLYDPFEYFANRTFEAARQDFVEVLEQSLLAGDGASSANANAVPDPPPYLVAARAHDRFVLGCAGERK
jgi:hypothetical protein